MGLFTAGGASILQLRGTSDSFAGKTSEVPLKNAGPPTESREKCRRYPAKSKSSKVLVTKQRFAIIRALLRRGLGNARMVLWGRKNLIRGEAEARTAT